MSDATMSDATMSDATMSDARIDALPKGLKMGWASGAFGIALLFNGIGALVFFYMIGILKIEPALAGSLIFVVKLLGAFTDASVGAWSDRIVSPRGRRRPFLFWGAFSRRYSYLQQLRLIYIWQHPQHRANLI